MQQSQPVSSTYGTTTPTNVDKDKEEQLWAQQRLVTALKRKVIEIFPKHEYHCSYSNSDQTRNSPAATKSSLIFS